MMRMRAHWWIYRNPADALYLNTDKISRTIESSLLHNMLRNHSNDSVGVLTGLQKNSLLLYLHAYQSLVWNRVVSKRVEDHGTNILIGDFVIPNDSIVEEENNDKEGEKPKEEGWTSRLKKCEEKLMVVTEDNIGSFSILDVVMPIPGHKARYPANDILMDYYLDALEADGFKEGFTSLYHKNPVFSLAGDYRHVFGKPTDMSWRFVQHGDPDEDLVLSDIQILKNEVLKVKEGDLMSVVVDMTLKSSTYATMALREATKADLGKSAQRALTEAYKQEVAAKRKLDEESSSACNEASPAKKLKSDSDDHVGDSDVTENNTETDLAQSQEQNVQADA